MSDDATQGHNDNVVPLSGLRKLLGIRFRPHATEPSIGALEMAHDGGSTMYLIARKDMAEIARGFQSYATTMPERPAATFNLVDSDVFHFAESEASEKD